MGSSCSCDVPSHGYTYPWEGNPNWSRAYVGSEEIFDYFKGLAVSYGVFDHTFLNHEVVGATWDTEAGKWIVQIHNKDTGGTISDEAEILINAGGFLK